MADFKTVAKVGAVPDGQGRTFTLDGRLVGVFRVGDDYFAINDLCPHMGASLASGFFESDLQAVTCPWHAWRFSVKDGTWLDNPKIRTDCYPVRIDGDSIQIQVPDRGTPGFSSHDGAACPGSECRPPATRGPVEPGADRTPSG